MSTSILTGISGEEEKNIYQMTEKREKTTITKFPLKER